ncbi:MAG: adenylosuccinate synthase [Candidatus Dormibacteraeota bacterium]|uniref:Adenylosuccinate synthetase n=2 Tax=Candidatus Dormiibacter inghamiae TaxID=3127013 RepID=A0A934NDX2_9BACT|nr:adenylosuccinate synthase [Candidatus Dormibacteraeota bacterium]MBJ7607345.1 adenylosuccinate synthase [Candidatus Dormibacteraeota bacterium]
MMVIIIAGAQWGDEGKGKVIDLLAERADMIVRPQGGANAGHTVVTEDGEFKFQLLPSGILYPHVTCVIGHGVVADPRVLIREIDQLRERGIEPDNLVISERAHMVMGYHPVFDQLEEGVRGDDRLGTTRRGIGPAYSDKIRRIGFRIGDLQKEAFMRKKLDFVVGQVKNPILTDLYRDRTFDWEEMLAEYRDYAARLNPYIRDIYPLVQDALDRQANILLEGAQATMLDLDLGTYPYVTSSNTTAGGALTGSGIPPTRVDLSLVVCKAYTTRVGYGPLPTELTDSTGDQIREKGTEFGTVTGRARRVGWFDGPVARYAVRVNGAESMALTKLDVLDALPEVGICTDYEFRGRVHDHPMANISHLKHCSPRYVNMPGWQAPIGQCRTWDELPTKCRAYVEALEGVAEVSIDLIGVGPRRDQFIMRKRSFFG